MVKEHKWVLKGKIVSGVKEGAFFTQLDWVREQCQEMLGFRPYPGTLNLELSSEYQPVFEAIQKLEAIALRSPDPAFCSGKTLPAKVNGVAAAIIIPAEEVRVHGTDIVEIIAPVGLRDALDVTDGDFVDVRIYSS